MYGYPPPQSKTLKNRTIFTGDNLPIMRGMGDESVDLIYLDPPFNSNKNYEAPIGSAAAGASFKDTWTLNDTDDAWWGEIADKHPALYKVIDAIGEIQGNSAKSYSIYMAVRLLEMHRILKATGSIYLHCDATMGHGLKMLMDSVLGAINFKNEIIWHYPDKLQGNIRRLPKNHDVIYFYTKSKDYTWNKVMLALDKSRKINRREWNKNTKKLDTVHDPDGKVVYDVYHEKRADSVWTIAQSEVTRGWQKTGYPTQKPISLLNRIIKASSNKDDVVLDPFCGCATTLVAADLLSRQWVGIDISPMAFNLVNKRLNDVLGTDFFGKKVIHRTDIPTRGGKPAPKEHRHTMYGEQKGNCKGCLIHFEYQNMTVDHIVPKRAGGGEEVENLQLLCGHCNSVKGTNPMGHLLAELKRMEIRK